MADKFCNICCRTIATLERVRSGKCLGCCFRLFAVNDPEAAADCARESAALASQLRPELKIVQDANNGWVTAASLYAGPMSAVLTIGDAVARFEMKDGLGQSVVIRIESSARMIGSVDTTIRQVK